MGRAPCCQKVGLKRGRWTTEEDELLVNYISQHGEGSWRSLPKNAGLLRCGKSCRLRWINYLRDGVRRGGISKEEDDLIVKLQATLGNKWSLIASHLPGRTDNEIKNYWNSHLSRKMRTTITIQQKTRSTARKRRSPTSSTKKEVVPVPVPMPEPTKAKDDSGPDGDICKDVDNLLDMDWEGFASHVCGELAQSQNKYDLLHTAELQAVTGFESFVSWLLSDVC